VVAYRNRGSSEGAFVVGGTKSEARARRFAALCVASHANCSGVGVPGGYWTIASSYRRRNSGGQSAGGGPGGIIVVLLMQGAPGVSFSTSAEG